MPDRYDDKAFCLAISAGFSGARLSHSHERQYYYVLQSLTLWSEMNHNMFKLWSLSEQDMLDQSNPYRLRDTGQGLNRLQSCPRVSKAVHGILAKVMRQVGNWVGSSVVHLGDTNVPNALMFSKTATVIMFNTVLIVDKYTQVARILNPIVLCSMCFSLSCGAHHELKSKKLMLSLITRSSATTLTRRLDLSITARRPS